MADRLHVRSGELGHARVSRHPDHPGVRMTIAALITTLARRGATS